MYSFTKILFITLIENTICYHADNQFWSFWRRQSISVFITFGELARNGDLCISRNRRDYASTCYYKIHVLVVTEKYYSWKNDLFTDTLRGWRGFKQPWKNYMEDLFLNPTALISVQPTMVRVVRLFHRRWCWNLDPGYDDQVQSFEQSGNFANQVHIQPSRKKSNNNIEPHLENPETS